MERRRFLGTLAAASLSVFPQSVLGRVARAQDATDAADPPGNGSRTHVFPEGSVIILVHGAWADGSCWRNVILPLERQGLKVNYVPIPLSSLTNDTTALNWALERTNGPVVLVGHAYSGAVIAAVREECVKSMVYITALAPDRGETVAKVFYLNPNPPKAPKMAPDSHGLIWMPADGFRRAVAHKASIEETKIAAAVQRPLGVHCIQEPAPVPLWKSRPSWFLIAEEDRMINPKTQDFMADRMHATIRRHPVGHTPMYSESAVLAGVILEAAQKTLLL
jgi:pimeloyl-ACP methyl ester carboxylesterase